MKSCLSEITPFHFNEIITGGLSLDGVYCLEMMEKDVDVEYFFKDNVHGEGILQGLYRKGYILNNQLTLEGKALLEFTRRAPERKLKLKKRATMSDDAFDGIWNSYPATDNVVKDGQILFKGTRALRKGNKQEIRVKISKILDEGKYSPDDIIRAIKFETNQKVEESIKRKENKLTFMQNIDTYFNQRTFEAYVEISKLANPATKSTTFITDI